MQESLMFRDHPEFDRQHEDQSTEAAREWSLSALQVLAGITAAGSLILMLADMAAPASFVPVQLRILLLMTSIGTLAIYLTMWSDARNERRHQESLAAIIKQAKRGEYVRGYVDGLERNGFQP